MLSGRRRWLPGITSTDWIAKGKAERAAVNTVVQVGWGAAAARVLFDSSEHANQHAAGLPLP